MQDGEDRMKPHILVVEDDQQTRITLARQLEYAGYRVTAAADGETAIDLVESETFDLVLTDIVMDDVSGIEVLHTARLQSYTPQVILLTGHGTMETALAAFRKGAYDYLLKPCEPEDLLHCVSQALKRRDAERQLQQAAAILTGHSMEHAQIPEHAPSSGSSHTHASPANIHIGQLAIGSTRHDVWFRGQSVRLTPIEYTLLSYLVERSGNVCGFSEIVQYTHGFDVSDAEAQQLLKPHIHNLRAKLDPDYLVSHRGVGYTLINPEKLF